MCTVLRKTKHQHRTVANTTLGNIFQRHNYITTVFHYSSQHYVEPVRELRLNWWSTKYRRNLERTRHRTRVKNGQPNRTDTRPVSCSLKLSLLNTHRLAQTNAIVQRHCTCQVYKVKANRVGNHSTYAYQWNVQVL